MNNEMAGIRIPIPSEAEQSQIAKYIMRYVEPIELPMKKLNEQIDKLWEYRQALITSAVTGKIDVTTDVPESEKGIV